MPQRTEVQKLQRGARNTIVHAAHPTLCQLRGLITDNASYITAKVFVDSCAALVIKHNLSNARAQQTAQYNQLHDDAHYEVGDLVLQCNHVLSDVSKQLSQSLRSCRRRGQTCFRLATAFCFHPRF